MAKKTSKKKKPPALVMADGIPVFCAHTTIVPIESVIPNPQNPNHHPEKQIELLSAIIRGQGWRNAIVVSDLSGFVVKGHGRLMAAQALGVAEVPVDVQHYETVAAEHADLIADNRIAELSEIDPQELADLIETVDTGDIDLAFTGFVESEIEALLTAAGDIPPEVPPPGSTKGEKDIDVLKIKVSPADIEDVARWLAYGEPLTPEGMGAGIARRMQEE